MRKAIILIITIFFLVAPVSAQYKTSVPGTSPANTNPYWDADRLFTFGEDAERDKQSLAVVERALSMSSDDYQWLWRAARGYYYVGDNAGKSDKLRYFERGMDTGQRSVARQPGAVEGHFWLAANYGGFSEQKGAFKALAMVKKIRAEMEKVLSLNNLYQDGAAYLALGEMDRRLPRLIGGNLQRAISWLEQGLKVAPKNIEMKLALAQAYQDAGRREDARRQLQEIIGQQVNPSRARSEGGVREKARRLLGKL